MTVDDLTLLVLAAGRSTRYGRLKQTDPVGPSGETIVDYSVFDALQAGFTRVVFVVRTDIEQEFRQAVGRRIERHVDVRYAFQDRVGPPRAKPWGTVHAVLSGEDVVGGPFGVVNADDFYGPGSFRVLAGHLAPDRPSAAMVGFALRNTLSESGGVTRGICRFAERSAGGASIGTERSAGGASTGTERSAGGASIGTERSAGGASTGTDAPSLVTVDETFDIVSDGAGGATGSTGRLSGDEVVSMNMWGFPRSAFWPMRGRWEAFLESHGGSETAELTIPEAVTDMIGRGELDVTVLRTGDRWFGVTHPDDRPLVVARLQELVDSGEYPAELWSGS